MMELPLIPWRGPFGLWQRRLAAKHGRGVDSEAGTGRVVLREENVLDGLHLSPAGHERMAQVLIPWLAEHAAQASVRLKARPLPKAWGFRVRAAASPRPA